jgi:tetratricopeptide (TPR) repeat protein
MNALGSLGYTLMSLGRLVPALAAVDEAVALYDSAPDRIDLEEAARVLMLRGSVLSIAGRPAPAAESMQRAEQLLPSGNDFWLGMHSAGLSNVAVARGDARSAASYAERALDYAGRTASPVGASFAHWPRGRAQLLLGEHANALHSFEQALATGATLGLEGYLLAGIALAHLGLGDPAGARRTAEHAITVARQRGTLAPECSAHLALAQILTQTEGASAAAAIETALREGERLIAETGAHSYEPLLREERARLAAALGDAAGRERALGEARRLFTEMGATGHLERLDREWGRA